MKEIITKAIRETAWAGSNIDNQIINNINSINENSQKLKAAIQALNECNGKRSKPKPTKKSRTLSMEEAIKYKEIYDLTYPTWVVHNKSKGCENAIDRIIDATDDLIELLKRNSAQFSELESASDNLDATTESINAEADDAVKGVSEPREWGNIISRTDALNTGAEDEFSAQNGTGTGIDEKNLYLYNAPLKFISAKDYFAGTTNPGIDTDSYLIQKWDGKEWKGMKWIPKETMQQIADEYVKQKKEFESKVRDGVIRAGTTIGTAITAAGSTLMDKLNKLGNQKSTENNSTVPLGVTERVYQKVTHDYPTESQQQTEDDNKGPFEQKREPEKILTSTDLKYIDHSEKIIKYENIEQQAIDKGLGKLAPQEEWKLKTNKSDGKQYTEIPTTNGGRLVIFNDKIRTESKVGKNVKAYNFFDVNNNLISAHSIRTELPSSKIQF